MAGRAERSSLPGILVGAVGVLALIAGFASGGPDAVGGVVFGGVALAAAAVMLGRPTPKQDDISES